MKLKAPKKNYAKCLSFLIMILFFGFTSCNTPKYTYMFKEGKHLDFSEGKWLLNRSKSNSRVFDTELYNNSEEQFKEILGSSLLEIVDVRLTNIIAPEISFDLNKEELIKLHKDSGCDFLINIKGNVISENAGSLSFPSNNSDYYATNEASVSIKIYDLKNGEIISSSQVNGKVVDQGSEFNSSNDFPILSTSAHTTMLKGAKRLINKYKKYQINN
ncbi:hypothetical protein [Algibacter sp. R77976]|uniref:hypothetical protein n=1 Tax=Algibacter sp. R77976 TaxID=3093873 RepID=UPI0037C4F8B1